MCDDPTMLRVVEDDNRGPSLVLAELEEDTEDIVPLLADRTRVELEVIGHCYSGHVHVSGC